MNDKLVYISQTGITIRHLYAFQKSNFKRNEFGKYEQKTSGGFELGSKASCFNHWATMMFSQIIQNNVSQNI